MPENRRFGLEVLDSADLLVVGAGFFGATIAERASAEGLRVVVLDKRDHIAGNAFSEFDDRTGIEIHTYGSHLFHTSNQRVWDYVNSFTNFNDYRHVVWTTHLGKTYPMPINLATITSFFGKSMSPSEAEQLLRGQGSGSPGLARNLEEKAIALVGEPLYDAFIRGYTAKQWQKDPRELPASIISRLPVRFNYSHRYFQDTWEGLPIDGYTKWVERMLAHPNIAIFLQIDFFEVKDAIPPRLPVVYTGPLDRYFDFAEGHLGWRTLDFELEHHQVGDFQGTSVMNFADEEIPHTRIHEFKHLHPERPAPSGDTVVMYEFSRVASKNDEPYYPINTRQDRNALERYRIRAKNEPRVFFGGRLGTYKYLDMHMAIASALTMWENSILPHISKRP